MVPVTAEVIRPVSGGGAPIEPGLSMAMAASGGRGEIITGDNGFGLAFKADALWVGTRTDAASGASGNLVATRSGVTRLRTAPEGSKSMTIDARMAFTPSVEVGIRQDGGDADVGRGLDVGVGLMLADGVTGLAVDVRIRRLLVHQADGFAENGLSVSVSYDPTPKTPLGFTARVSPAWGGDAMKRGVRGGSHACWHQARNSWRTASARTWSYPIRYAIRARIASDHPGRPAENHIRFGRRRGGHIRRHGGRVVLGPGASADRAGH